ncbi:MAG: phospho-N-acetylmuramoyl-pentapeptide-transferase [Clostridia bacterium]|jgi:phospho-N-acetylmuramoyl-pentapeptide-transferase|nr:phospho-N-acetylmuramoyl-pentapeptide-transferase [Clostridia bacterium]
MKTIFIALLSASLASALLMLALLPLLKRLKAGQYILGYVKEHKNKSGTPTMGGLAFITAIIIVSFCLLGFKSGEVNLTLTITAGFMVVGFLDDFLKIYRKENEGLKPYQKIIFQVAIATVAAIFCYLNGKTQLNIPFAGVSVDIKWGIIPLVIFIFIATVNCVNLTDGLDGLAGGTSCAYLLILGVMLAMKGVNSALLCFAGLGAVAAFLVFNSNKAAVFMGDTGSLALGGFISCISVFSGNSLYIPIIGVMFVISGISVIVQVIYYKRTRRRVFLMSPIHHHFQMKGHTECKISYAYFALTCLVGIICLIFW